MWVKHLVVALAGAVALSALPAAAGPSQAGVSPPGGFVAACASEVSDGGQFLPGSDLAAKFTGYPGRSSCQGQYFAGTAGSTAQASYSTAAVQTASSVGGTMGTIGFAASTLAPSNSMHAVSASGGGWSDRLVVDLAGHSGESAIWLYTMQVGGTMASTGAGVASASVRLSGFKNKEELFASVPGFDQGNSDGVVTDRQRVNWGASQNVSRVVDDLVTFAVPVTLGQSFVWGVYATASASVGFSGIAGNGSSRLDFIDGLQYGGAAGLFIGGVEMNGYTLQSDSGIDWMQAAAVPEPAAWALWSAGLLTVVTRLRRRRSGL